MGLFQKIFALVKEELQGETKQPAKKQGTPKASANKQKGDSFGQLCAKAKAGDLAAQYKLFDQYANKTEKRDTLKAYRQARRRGREGHGL